METTKKPVKPYPTELRERAVRMVKEHAGDRASEWATIRSIAEKAGCSPETLRLWVRQAERDRGERGLPVHGRADAAQGAGARGPGVAPGARDPSQGERVFCGGGARLPVEAMIEYVALYQKGDSTLHERLELLQEQRSLLLEQQKKTQETIERLDYKISRYKKAVKSGKLTWDEPDCCKINKEEK